MANAPYPELPLDVRPVDAARLVEALVGAAWATDSLGMFLYVSADAPAFRGQSIEELNADGAGWRRIVHEDDYATTSQQWDQALKLGAPFRFVHRTISSSGAFAWTTSSGQPIRDRERQIVGWYGSILITGANDGRHSLDLELVHPHDRDAVRQASARAFFHATPQVSSYRALQPDGSFQWVELKIDPDSSSVVEPGLAIARKDDAWTSIDNLGETVEAVQAAKLIENVYGGAWALDARGNFTYATPTSQTSIGLTLEDLNERLTERDFMDGGEHGWKRTVHPDDYPQMAKGFRTGLLTGEPWHVEYRILRANGDYVWHRVGALPTHDAHGRLTGWYGVSVDIDVYKRTEAALRESERNLQQLIDAVPAQLWTMTPDGRLSYVNQQFVDAVGIDICDLTKPDGTRSHADVHPDFRKTVEEAILHGLETGEPYIQRYPQLRRDGGYRWTEVRARPLLNDDQRIVQWYGVCFDVDNEVRASDDLRLAREKLAVASQSATLAEVSASIAHEVNQPIAAVVANAHACLRWLTMEPPRLDRAKATVEWIIRDANATSDVVGRTRALFQQSAPENSVTALGEAIADAARLVDDVAKTHGVSVRVEAGCGHCLVSGDRLQIQQVLVNLMRNGIEAMAETKSRRTLVVRAAEHACEIRTEIEDQGSGLKDPKAIFDPFYTTKRSGMGMGLAISRSIIERQGGKIWAENLADLGARFVFTLPSAGPKP